MNTWMILLSAHCLYNVVYVYIYIYILTNYLELFCTYVSQFSSNSRYESGIMFNDESVLKLAIKKNSELIYDK